MEAKAQTKETLLREVKRFRAEVQALRRDIEQLRRTRQDLVPLSIVAAEKGVSVRTIYRWCNRHSIPVRDKSGAPKTPGDRSASFVDRREFEMKRSLHTPTARNS